MQLHAAAVQASTDAAQRDDADTSSAASVEQLYPLADAHKGAEIKASGKVLTNLLTAVCAGIGNEHGCGRGGRMRKVAGAHPHNAVVVAVHASCPCGLAAGSWYFSHADGHAGNPWLGV